MTKSKTVSFAPGTNSFKSSKSSTTSSSRPLSHISKSNSIGSGISKSTSKSKLISKTKPKLKPQSKAQRKMQKHKDSVLQAAVDASLLQDDFLKGLHVGLNHKQIQQEKKKEMGIKSKEAEKEVLKQLEDISNMNLKSL